MVYKTGKNLFVFVETDRTDLLRFCQFWLVFASQNFKENSKFVTFLKKIGQLKNHCGGN
jgi:hypothetical protein